MIGSMLLCPPLSSTTYLLVVALSTRTTFYLLLAPSPLLRKSFLHLVCVYVHALWLQVTPMINVDLTRPLEEALPALSLEDVWRFYHDPSLHGREVGDGRAPPRNPLASVHLPLQALGP